MLDQGIPYSTTEFLRQVHWDVVHTVDLHLERAMDRQIIEYARQEGRVCATLDADFHSIIAVENAEN